MDNLLLEIKIRKAVKNAIYGLFGWVDLPDGIHEITEPSEINKFAHTVWNILQRSYKNIGGFMSYENEQSMANLISLLILCVNNKRVVACAIYRDDLGGQKLNGCGTIDGSEKNKALLRNVIIDDIQNIKKYHWVEVSYPLEKWFKEEGGNPIPSQLAHKLLHKAKSKITEMGDGVHYSREMGREKIVVTKAIYGFNSETTYNRVMKRLEEYTGFTDYNDFKDYANSLPKITEEIDYTDNNPNEEIALAMEYIIQIGNMWEDGILELTPNMGNCLCRCIEILEEYPDKDRQIIALIKNGKYYLSNMEVVRCYTSDNSNYLLYPLLSE